MRRVPSLQKITALRQKLTEARQRLEEARRDQAAARSTYTVIAQMRDGSQGPHPSQ
jgi:hypothetical protein